MEGLTANGRLCEGKRTLFSPTVLNILPIIKYRSRGIKGEDFGLLSTTSPDIGNHCSGHIRDKVDARITDTTIEVFSSHSRIASHRRLYGRPGQYSTVTEYMPPDHQKYLEWNGDRFRKWAETIGINTYRAVDGLLTSGRVEQQSYRACMGLLKLAERKSPQKLEAACAKALQYSDSPSYKSIRNILTADKSLFAPAAEETEDDDEQYGITRGARHYGGSRS